MPEVDYTNRELDAKFSQIVSLLQEIKEQTTKTNGRVTRLEFWKEGVMAKFTGIASAVAVGWVLIKELILK